MEFSNEKNKGTHQTLHITRHFDQPVEKIWEAWTQAWAFKKWWGPKNYDCPDCSIDLKIGGKVHASMRDVNTGKKMWSVGTYLEIDAMKKLVLTDNFSDEKGNVLAEPSGMPGDWSKQMVISVSLKDLQGKTALILEHGNIPTESFDDCVSGWQESLDKLNLL